MTIAEEMLSTLVAPGVSIHSVEPHIFSVYPVSEPIHDYDQNVSFYDRVIGNPLYNRLMWGYSISEFADFAHTALASTTDGWVLDAGCGSLVFTAGTYSTYTGRPVVMLDQSIQMLRAAKSKLVKLAAEVPPNIVFLQGDILRLPFKIESFRTIISMNIVHVLDNANAMLGELFKVLAKGGGLFITSLVLGRSLGDRYLRYLHKSGGVALPRKSRQVLAALKEMGFSADHHTKGNMLFVRAGQA